ncbi:MAG: LPS-assembly protein [Paracoccaceae bacterium]|jgi:LPS-assembly protein
MRVFWLISLVALLTGSWLMVATSAATAQTGPSSGASSEQDSPAAAPPALLVADRVFITTDRTLIAEGNVEAFQGDTRLRASRITFDRKSGQLTIDGPIRIDQGGTITVLANSAQMDKGLQNGILTGARMVLDQQLQLAALQMTRVGGRYTQLYKTSVTSCHVCKDGRPPLWQIRARKVIHDQQERLLYFEDAHFRVLDVPIFYFPRLRLPDPTLKRATGLLIPSVRTTSQLGTGLKVPYFFRLGDHKDLTLAPYLSSKTRTLNARYRQAFRTGGIVFDGAYTRDDLIPGEGRGYLFGTGFFNLPRDFQLNFDLKGVSDDAYLVDYGLPDLDRLQSEISLIRAKRDSLYRLGLIHYKSLRDSEDESFVPSGVVDAHFQQRFFPAKIGGELRMGVDLHGHYRSSSLSPLGRDIARATADIDWRRSWTFAGGLRADWQIGASADAFDIYDDNAYPPSVTRHTPRTALTLRLPMTRTMARGATHFLEPVAQIGWTDVNGGAVPNDESGFVEFDQGNLLSLSRFPSNDRREDGATFVYGLNWARYAPTGWQANATIGQVFRENADPDFTKSSGLAGTSSDILMAGQLKLVQGLNQNLGLTARSLLNNSLNFSKVELRGDWANQRSNVSGTYLWLGTDTAENRPDPLSEIWFDGTYKVNPRWSASANLRYEINESRATSAGIGLVYQNECVTVDISLNRRYTSSTSVEPSTDFGFTIALNGFAVESGTKEYRRTCGKS